jgi:hypothetical protein
MDYITKSQIHKFIKAINSDKDRVEFARNDYIDRLPSWKKNNPNRIQQKGICARPSDCDKFIKLLNRKFHQQMDLTIIKISPFGFARCCHSNSAILCEILGDDWEVVLGYNFTHCPCGRYTSAEIHSVCRHKPSGKFVDFTKDYDGLTHKGFYPLQSVMDMGADDWFRNEDVLPYILYKNTPHRCVGVRFTRQINNDHEIEVYNIPENVGGFIDEEEFHTRESKNQMIIYALENPDANIKFGGLAEIDKIINRGDYDTHFNQ